ncbi:Transcription factor like [Quillaja saponaria]|uniref:Transcription factor like n=1 Tax=Quillaja saponaria TaxID=32244 RepID=A0AAD7PXM3_QUISA|nr:Transcription factor like [Quillaja saponaria]
MTSNPKRKSNSLLSLRIRRRRTPRRTLSRLHLQARSSCSKARKSFKIKAKPSCGSNVSVSDKLEALKNLIPVHQNVEIVKADQLFQETADYIVMLRTQVVILQKLIEIYGNTTENENAVS